MRKKFICSVVSGLIIAVLFLASCTTSVTEEEIVTEEEKVIVTLTEEEETEPGTVVFPDENLDTAIREHLSKGIGEEITTEELATLTTFVADSRGITDISGIQYCSNLTELHLQDNQIIDLSPLVENTGLGSGDVVYPNDNPLSEESMDVYIPQLEERGVEINWGCPP